MSDVGRVWKSESCTEKDPVSGLPVTRLTGYLGHSHHLYFTNPGWYDGGKRLLIASDRGNATNLFSLELASGELTQLTDFPPTKSYPSELQFIFSSLNQTRPEVYFWRNRELIALNLKNFEQRALYRLPDGYSNNMTNVSADGQHVLTGIYEDLSAKFKVNLLHGYVGFEEYWAAKPHSQIVAINTDGSGSRVLFEENYWIGHVNTSPTQSHLVSFCHEGPWDKVDCRMWMLDRNTGKVWKLRPTEKGEHVGHEYWLADGIHVGFHGSTKIGNGKHVYGWIKYDNTGLVEAPFPHASTHFHSNTKDLVVGDSTPHGNVLLWQFRDGAFSESRVLCRHRCSFHIQQLHVHPRFSPDGTYVLFTSDTLGYGNVYKVDVPKFESLPKA